MLNFKSFMLKNGLAPLLFFNKHKDKFRGSAGMWRKISFGTASIVGIWVINGFINKMIKQSKKPEFVEFENLHRRSKQFPWGDANKTLFYNPEVNASPDSYES